MFLTKKALSELSDRDLAIKYAAFNKVFLLVQFFTWVILTIAGSIIIANVDLWLRVIVLVILIAKLTLSGVELSNYLNVNRELIERNLEVEIETVSIMHVYKLSEKTNPDDLKNS